MSNLADYVWDYAAACFPGLWIQTHEQAEAVTEIRDVCLANRFPFYEWDCVNGLRRTWEDESGNLQVIGLVAEKVKKPTAAGDDREVWIVRRSKVGDRLSTLDAVLSAYRALALEDGKRPLDEDGENVPVILLVHNIQSFVASPITKQLLQFQLHAGKSERRMLIGLATNNEIPVEVEKLLQFVEHELPDRHQLKRIVNVFSTEEDNCVGSDDDLENVIDAATGLTQVEAENAYALSLLRKERIEPQTVFSIKANILKKGTGALTLHRGDESFTDVGGFAHLKEFCRDSLGHREANPKFRPRGVFLTGVSGGGKSLFAKALGNEMGRPTLRCDIGALKGSLMGQSQANLRNMLAQVDAMEPCVLMID
jgi:hypothetical protein